MVSFGEKAKITKAENFNSGRIYVITTVKEILQTIVPIFVGLILIHL